MGDEYRLDEVFNVKMIAEARHRQAARESNDVFFGRTLLFTRTRGAQPNTSAHQPDGTRSRSNQDAEGYERAWRAFQRVNRQTIGHQQSFIAPSKSLMRLTIPACAVGTGHPELVR